MPETEEDEAIPRDVDLGRWVEQARANVVQYRDRQVAEILLTAIGLTPTLNQALVLKGGTLMAIGFGSPRGTGDVDFTATAPPEGFEDLLRNDLNKLLEETPRKLGYLDLVCRVQSIEKKPRPQNFAKQNFPALNVRVASARRGTAEERALHRGAAPRVLHMEISFRDEVYNYDEIVLGEAGVRIRSFTAAEIVAEKFRALIQQPIRKRNRRQDVYDIAYLIDHFPELLEPATVLDTLVKKCRTRGIEPGPATMRDPEIRDRAGRDWPTLELELEELGDFDQTYERVRSYYEALPWPGAG